MIWLDTITQGILLGGLYALFAAGLTEAEIRRMACTNPNALLARDG